MINLSINKPNITVSKLCRGKQEIELKRTRQIGRGVLANPEEFENKNIKIHLTMIRLDNYLKQKICIFKK